jgi:hypothetical protein
MEIYEFTDVPRCTSSLSRVDGKIMVLMHRGILLLPLALSFLSLKSPIHVPRRSVF